MTTSSPTQKTRARPFPTRSFVNITCEIASLRQFLTCLKKSKMFVSYVKNDRWFHKLCENYFEPDAGSSRPFHFLTITVCSIAEHVWPATGMLKHPTQKLPHWSNDGLAATLKSKTSLWKFARFA